MRVNALLQCLTYQRANGTDVGSRTVTVSLRESGQTLAVPDSRTINITGVNDAPQIVIAPVIAATEQVPQPIATSILITDVDSAAGAIVFTASVNSGVLTATASGGVTLITPAAGAQVAVQGTEAAIRTWLQTAGNLIYTYLLDAAGGTVTLTIRVDDKGFTPAPAQITTATRNLTLTFVNDAPTLSPPTFARTYTENTLAVTVAPTITVTDPDSNNIASATASITGGTLAAGDVLTVTPTAGITAVWNPGTGVLTLTGTQPKGTYQTALQTIRYATTSENPSTTSRIIQIRVSDGSVTNPLSAASVSTVAVVAVNDAPTLSPLVFNRAYTENSLAVSIAPTITVADVDSTNLFSATATFTGGKATGDVMTATVSGGIFASFNFTTGVLSLTGSAPLATYQTALQSVRYGSTSENPSTANRTIAIVVSDGSLASAQAVSTVGVTAVNDAPALNPLAFTPTFTEDGGPVQIAPSITVIDVDSADIFSATVRFTGGFQAGQDVLTTTVGVPITVAYNGSTGVLTLSGVASKADYQARLQAGTYNNTSQNPVTSARTLQIVIADNPAKATSPAATSTVAVTAVDDAPVLTANTGMTFTHPATGTLPFTVTVPPASLTAGDVDSAANQIHYAIVSLPITGTIKLEVSPGVFVQRTTCPAATGYFTQDDLQNNRVKYVLNSALRPFDASLGFVVQNGTAVCPGVPQATYTVRVRAP